VKRSRNNKVIGIALFPGSLLIAELAEMAGTCKLVASVQFDYPEGLSLERPVELGQALAKSLNKARLGSRDVVIGLPARWLITRRKEVPPAAPAIAASTLRLSAETEFSSEPRDLAIDFAGQTSAAAASEVMLIGTNREIVDRCVAFARAAGFRLHAITATGAAMASLSGSDAGKHAMVLSLMPSGAELVVQERGVPVQLRHIALANGQTQDPAALVSELRRTLAGLPQTSETRTLMLCGHSDLARALPAAAQDRLGLSAKAPSLAKVVVNTPEEAQRFAPAIAVGLTQLADAPDTVDFLHSRLAPPPERKNRRPMVWAAMAAAVVILGVAGAFYDLQRRTAHVASIKQQLAAMDPDIKKAKAAATRLGIARDWSSGKPRFLACLSTLTAVFPDEGSIWATSFNLRTDMVGQVSGKASGQPPVFALLDKLRDNKQFVDPKLVEMRDDNKTSREISFTISFTFKAPE
jgi:Tfp pilus assembly PilM family ATPase